jgi:hypothetical protein
MWLPTITTAGDLKSPVLNEDCLTWNQCFSFRSYGAPSLLGVRRTFCAKVKKVDTPMDILHLLMHRENTVFCRPSELKLVMKEVTQIVNFIKTRSSDNKVCSQMCPDIGSDDMHILYHSEVRGLPRVNVLQRAVSLLSEVETFLSRLQSSQTPSGYKIRLYFRHNYRNQ